MDLGLWNAAQCVRGDLARSMWGTVENQSVCRTGLRPVHPVWGEPQAWQRDTAATNLQFSSPLVARRAMTDRLLTCSRVGNPRLRRLAIGAQDAILPYKNRPS